MLALRREKDSLGWVPVPKDALYGAQTERAVRNYPISGRTAHPALIRAYLRIKEAAARSNFSCGVISKRNKDLIVRAVDRLIRRGEEEWTRIFPVDPYQAGAGTSQNMNVNEVIANTANLFLGNPPGTYSPIHPNDHVNRSQSTNDTFPTAMRLALIEASQPLVTELLELSSLLRSQASRWRSIPKAARTHLQDAVPMRLGQEFGAYASTVSRCANWLSQGRDTLRELGIGGSAAGTGLNVPLGYPMQAVRELEKKTGEKLFLAENLYELMQSQSQLSLYSAMLRTVSLELTRFCNDLRLLASGPMTGLAEIRLPPVQPGSSIMPGKVNPSILEMANQAWFSVLGFDQSVAYCMQAGQLELNVMMPMMAYSLLEATKVATNAARVLRQNCIEGLEPNIPVLKDYFERTPQIATALSPTLGYAKTAEIVKEALSTGKSVVELIREKKLIPEKKLVSLMESAMASHAT